MPNIELPPGKRDFHCNHCNGRILIPLDLPPTTGPCPHCGGEITSPAPIASLPPTFRAPSAPQLAVLPSTAADPAPPAAVPATAPQPPAVPATTPPPYSGAQVVSQPPPTPEKVQEKTAPIQAIENAKPGPASSTATPAPPATKLPDKKDSGKTKATSDKPRKKSGLIPAMLVLLVLFLCAGAAVIFVSKEMGKNISPPVISPSDPTVMEASYIRSGWQKEAYQLLRNYMAATSSSEKLPFILNGQSMSSRLDDFYGGGVISDADTPADAFSIYELSEEDRKRGLFMMVYDQPPQFEMKEFFRPLASLEVQYGIDEADLLLSTLARVGNFAMDPLRVHAFFKRTPEGLKLDWEIFAQTKYRTFQNFVELPEPNHSAVFRVFIVEDVPDKSRLETGTRTYRVTDPANTGDSARVNIKVDSEIGRTLSIINWRGTKESRPITRTATVELKWAGEPSAPELEISRFICWEFLGLGGQETPSTASSK